MAMYLFVMFITWEDVVNYVSAGVLKPQIHFEQFS